MSVKIQKISITLNAVPPYDFALTASYATYFRGHYGTDSFQDGVFRRLLEIDGRLYLASVTSRGTLDSSELTLNLAGVIINESIIDEAKRLISRILGTEQNLVPFYSMASDDAVLSRLITELYGLHIPQTGSVFEALILAILGQQISALVAQKLRSALIETYGAAFESEGTIYHVFPRPEILADAGLAGLRAIGLSVRKAEYVLEIARKIAAKELDLEALRTLFDNEVIDTLTDIRGVGEWTAQWLLIRALGRTDGFPASDLALLRFSGILLGKDSPLKPDEAQALFRRWSPYRSFVTSYLFAAARGGRTELFNPVTSGTDVQ